MNERRDFLRGSAVALGWAAFASQLPLLARAGMSDRTAPPPAPGAVVLTPEAEREFFRAVRAGDLPRVREQIVSTPGLMAARDPVGRSGFAVAILDRHVEVAEFLRAEGHEPDTHESALALDWERFEALATADHASVNRDHPIGGTAMYAGAIGGAATQIWRVHAQGGEPNRAPRGEAGFTPVRAALEHPDLNIAELTAATLLANGAATGGPQAGGSSPLHAAAARGSLAIVEMLIRKDADLTATDARGRTALELARTAGHPDTVRLLERHTDIPRDHSTSRTRYDVAGAPYRIPDLSAIPLTERTRVVGASHTDLDAAREAVSRQPLLVHSVATTTEGAVEAGAHMGRTDIVDFLLEQGAPYSLPTALMRNDQARVSQLLEQDPLRVNERGAHDFAMLWYPVIGHELLDMAEVLIAHGADVERQHWMGTTALHFAALGGQIDMAALLIEHGADVNRAGRKFGGEPRTPLQLAEARDETKLAQFLKEKGARA